MAEDTRVALVSGGSRGIGRACVARLAADGLSNKDIAAHLFVTVGTVQTTLVRVYRKLDVSSRKDLAGALG